MRVQHCFRYLAVLAWLSVGESLVCGQNFVQQLTTNSTDETWGVRNSATSRGQVLWVDGGGSVILFDATSTSVLQAQDTLGAVDNVVFTLGSGSNAEDVVGVWRRGTDSGWVSLNGAPPVPVMATNPINPADQMNAEGVAAADGSVFMILQAGTFKHVFRVDPVGGLGVNLTGNAQVPGAQGRLSTSQGQAAWPWLDNTDDIYKLDFYDGSSLRVIDTNIVGNPDLAHGRIVYMKAVGGLNQIFLYDSTSASPGPFQLTADTDGTNAFPRTDGRHIAWLHTDPGATNTDIVLNGGLRLTVPWTALPNDYTSFREHPFQLNRGQLLWEDTAQRLEYYTGAGPYALDLLPGISFAGNSGGTPCCLPFLSDGFVAWTGLSSDGGADREVFLLTASAPTDGARPSPPLLLHADAAPNQVTLSWDSVLGASSYNLYVAYDAALTRANYSALAGGREFAGVASPFTLTGLTNRVYFFAVSTVEGSTEGPSSPPTMVALWAATSAPVTNYYTIAAGLTNGGVAYASGGRMVLQTTNAGLDWAALAGGIAGLDVRALAVDGPTVYAATRDIFNVGPSQILRSLNAGLSWTVVVPDGGQLGEQNKTIVIDPVTPFHLYAADFRLPTMTEPEDSFLIRSTDSGTTWTHLPDPTTPLGAEIRGRAVALNPLNPSIVYVGGSGTPNLVRSADGGTNWTDVSVGSGYVYALAIDPVTPETLYAGVYDSVLFSQGVLKSTNSGASWFASNAGLLLPLPTFYQLLLDPRDPAHIHAATDGGYFASLDAGAHWTAESFALSTPDAQTISAMTLTASRELLAATAGGIYRLDLSTLYLSRPRLTITPAGSNAILSWADSAAGFSLQSSSSLTPPSLWSAVSLPVIHTNNQQEVTVPLTNQASFYRLIGP